MADTVKYFKPTAGNVVEHIVEPYGPVIEGDRTFVGEGYVEIELSVGDEILGNLYDPSAESEDKKTAASFTAPGVDSNGFAQWYDPATGNLMQFTYDEQGAPDGEQQVP